MNELENPFICGIYDDYEYCLNNDAFISCKSLLEEIINEATWDNVNNNKYRHYVKHVCKDDENFTGKAYDSFGRIKFPNMSFGKYLTAAEKLADISPVQEEPSEEKVFGWKAYVGWIKKVACIKFKQSNLKDKEGNPLYEYVAYTPILGGAVEKELDSGARYKYHKILDRLIFSYGLTDSPDNFKKIDSLSLDELTESLDVVRITESILNEANRQQLLQKSRKAKNYVPSNQYKGRNRFERRTKSSISATVRDYNMIQMDPLFKRDILEFKIPVMGETDVYVVDVRVDGLLAEIRKQLMANKGTLEFKVVLQSLMKVLNIGNVYIGCNCLHPDTKIKLLDGTTPTVKEMCERFDKGETLWVYSTDDKGDFKPGQVERVWKTGEVTDFIKVTLDNGEEIITTPEHPYMLRDGTYAFACDLKEGQSLMPMYFNYHNDYEQVKLNTETRGWRSIYKLVAEALKSEEIQEALARVNPEDNMAYDVAVHHKDFNKHNNNPDNLEIMTAREHWNYHASLTWENKPEEMKQHVIETARENVIKRNANPTNDMIKSRKEWQEKGRLRNYDADRKEQQSEIAKKYLVPNRYQFTAEESSKYSKEAWERGCFNTDKFHEARIREGKRLFNNKDNQLHMRKAKMLKVLQQMVDSGVELTEENYNKYRLKIKASKADDVFGSFNNMISEFQLNHKVVKVEKVVLESTSVYDIKVKEWENFVVEAGVVLHNCPDARYRMAYNQTKNDYKAGYKERRPSDITNPLDDLGAGCKHVLLVLANLDWAVKVASVINNYIKYCKEHLQRNYADYIFPKVYGVKYDKAVQLNLFDNGLFPEDQKTMDTVIGQGFRGKDNKGKFVPGNEFRFQKKEPEEQPEEEPENPLDLKFHKEEEPEEESPETES